MSDKLMPCPCCGSAPEVTYKPLPYGHCWTVDCVNEECPRKPGSWYYYVRSDAIDAWNGGEHLATRSDGEGA